MLSTERRWSEQYLHPTMYLLIPGGQGHHSAGQNDLHPTMYLLIRIYFF